MISYILIKYIFNLYSLCSVDTNKIGTHTLLFQIYKISNILKNIFEFGQIFHRYLIIEASYIKPVVQVFARRYITSPKAI